MWRSLSVAEWCVDPPINKAKLILSFSVWMAVDWCVFQDVLEAAGELNTGFPFPVSFGAPILPKWTARYRSPDLSNVSKALMGNVRLSSVSDSLLHSNGEMILAFPGRMIVNLCLFIPFRSRDFVLKLAWVCLWALSLCTESTIDHRGDGWISRKCINRARKPKTALFVSHRCAPVRMCGFSRIRARFGRKIWSCKKSKLAPSSVTYFPKGLNLSER